MYDVEIPLTDVEESATFGVVLVQLTGTSGGEHFAQVKLQNLHPLLVPKFDAVTVKEDDDDDGNDGATASAANVDGNERIGFSSTYVLPSCLVTTVFVELDGWMTK